MCTEQASGSGSSNTEVPDFVHLHGHTLKSKGDATARPKDLVKKAFADGQRSIAVTDHGIASSWVEMAKACRDTTSEAQAEERRRLEEAGLPIDEDVIKQIGIKFIPGVEMYETNDRTIQNKAEMERLGYSTHHFLLLPVDNEGLKNLNRIISDASLNGQFYARNRTDMNTIQSNGWGKGLIATSACLASRTSQAILAGDLAGAQSFAEYCATIFDEFYLELQDNNIKDQYIVNQGLIQIAQNTGLPLVYTQDYHYVEANEQDLHDTWICIGRGQEKADPNRQGYDGGPYHFATQAEMWESVEQGRIPQEAYDNTVIIANKCNVEFDFKKNRFPKYKFVPVGYNADSYLYKQSFDALWDYAIDKDEMNQPINIDEYKERLAYELKVISDKGYSDYFLILGDIFGFCYRENIAVGPGRGSGAGSMVAYLNKITGLDPIEHKLLFERFLNPERMSSPDIDFDIMHSRREEVFQYIIDRFGKEHTAQIVTYGTEKLRSGVDDLCRTLKQVDENDVVIAYGQDVADVIKKTIPLKFPDQSDITYAKMKKLAEDPESFREDFRDQTDKLHIQAKEFMQFMNQYPDLHTGIKFIEGLVRNYGIHAAAVVITDEPITDHIPVYKSTGLMPVTAFSMKEVDDDLQMLKLDALGLSTMTVVQQAVDNINRMKTDGTTFDIRKIDMEDDATFKTIRDGHTNGIFQISGGPITGYTKRVRPQSFNEIVDILALNRRSGAVKVGYMLGSPNVKTRVISREG
jgi:DNA polymerase-3 subunit alpha